MWTFLSPKEKLILLSGIFEGEGHYGNHKAGKYKSGKSKYVIESTIEMVDEDIIEKFFEFFKCGSVCKPKIRNNNYQTYRWRVTGVEALKVIHKMLPYLGKRKQEKYYGMVQSIRDGSKDGSAYLLQPSENKTSNVRRSAEGSRGHGSRGERIRG